MMQRARDDRGQTGDVEQWTESKLGKFAKLGYLLDVTVEEISDALRGRAVYDCAALHIAGSNAQARDDNLGLRARPSAL
jgi:hypothetical protein